VKTSRTQRGCELLRREAAIHKKLKHPLVLGYRGHLLGAFDQCATITTEIVGRRSLASHLPSANGAAMYQLRGETRIARIIVDIVLAMRYIHSHGIIHRALTPDNDLLDWEWNVRIRDFGQNMPSYESNIPLLTDLNSHQNLPSGNLRYVALECYDNKYGWESDVFSFGLILYELVVGSPAFSKDLSPLAVVQLLVVDNVRPDSSEFVLPSIRTLIRECWQRRPCHRPSFNEILDWLTAIQFKLTPNVNSSKLSRFVENILALEEGNVIPVTLISESSSVVQQ
jgi:serine/threonine protein kinase